MANCRHLGGALILVLASGVTSHSLAAPPPAPAPANESAIVSISTEQKVVEDKAAKAQLTKLKATPKPATDAVYQQAAKKAGLDFNVLHTEYLALVAEKDVKIRETKIQVMRDKYTPLMLKVSKDAGVDVVAERKKAIQAYAPMMASAAPKTAELTVRPPASPPLANAAPRTAENSVMPARATSVTPTVRELPFTGFVMTEPPATELPAPPPPQPSATTLTLGPPFAIVVRPSLSRSLDSVQAGRGYMEVARGTSFFDMGIESASLGDAFVMRAGHRRADVVADLADVNWHLFGNAFGHIMGMVRVALLVNSGGELLCSDARTLSEFVSTGLAWVDDRQQRPQMRLACSIPLRPAGSPEKTFTASVRFSTTSVSEGTPADMFSQIYGRISSMRVTTSP